MASHMFSRDRKVKVLATLGPASGSPEMIEKMLDEPNLDQRKENAKRETRPKTKHTNSLEALSQMR